MDITEHRCWDILLDDERSALLLSLGNQKSTWEAGEIMNKSHYKYLEIQQRGVRFMQIFRRYYDLYDQTIPEEVNINPSFHDYLMLVIDKRKSVKEAVAQMDYSDYKKVAPREIIIMEQMDILYSTNNPAYRDLYELIIEFDRWNNFRILPSPLQMPSAFKRRNKARFNKHLKNLSTLPQFSIDTIIQKSSYTGKYEKNYLTILTPHKTENFEVVEVRDKAKYTTFIGECGLALFKDKKTALDFGDLITAYLGIGTKSCIEGQKFWPQFREYIRKSINYKHLENITPNKKFLIMAFGGDGDQDDSVKVQKILDKRRKQIERIYKGGEARGNDNQFWN